MPAWRQAQRDAAAPALAIAGLIEAAHPCRCRVLARTAAATTPSVAHLAQAAGSTRACDPVGRRSRPKGPDDQLPITGTARRRRRSFQRSRVAWQESGPTRCRSAHQEAACGAGAGSVRILRLSRLSLGISTRRRSPRHRSIAGTPNHRSFPEGRAWRKMIHRPRCPAHVGVGRASARSPGQRSRRRGTAPAQPQGRVASR